MKWLLWIFPLWLVRGLAFGGDSSSSSTSVQNTLQQDNRATGGDSSNNISAQNSTVNVDVHPTDYGAVLQGVEVANNSVNASGSLAGYAVDMAGTVAGRAIDANTDLSKYAIGTSALTYAKFADDTAGMFHGALDFASNVTKDANKSARQSASDAMKFGQSALESASTSQDKALAAATRAVDTTFGTAVEQIQEAYSTAKAGDQKEVSKVALAVVAIVGAAAFFGMKRG